MKARNKKTRWALICLLFGLLAATGLILTRHGDVRFVTAAGQPVAPKHNLMAQPHAPLVAATGGTRTLEALVGTPAGHEAADGTYSNNPQAHVTGHVDSSSAATTAPGAGPENAVGGASGDNGHPAMSAAGPTRPQDGRYAYNGYVPLDCGLPAGCGEVDTGHVTHQPSLTVGTVPVAHNSQGSISPGEGPNDPGQGSDPPPGPDTSVAAAPELDPATLAGAITLLLGALAILRGRRVPVARGRLPRVTR